MCTVAIRTVNQLALSSKGEKSLARHWVASDSLNTYKSQNCQLLHLKERDRLSLFQFKFLIYVTL